eukprot:10866463-Ditylum_brightwellii.AAC.1
MDKGANKDIKQENIKQKNGLYIALTWNLMCCSDSTKNVKEGTRKRVPRHVYTNAFNYPLCPIGALSLYLSIFPGVLNDSSGKLFPGADQGDQFLKGYESLLTKYENEVHHHGYELYELGTHSIHKGVTTYASSGSTAGPGGISVCIRGGWTMGK